MALVTRHRGVHHQLVLDVPQAAAFVVGLTRALAQQTYQSRDMFLQSHGMGAPTHTAAQLLVSCPLPHPGREAVFRALTAVPHLGPQAAHAIVGAFASLGPLMAANTDPGRTKKQKLDMIATLVRSGSGTGRRVVGPAAADKLLRILTATDPDTPVHACA